MIFLALKIDAYFLALIFLEADLEISRFLL